MADLPAVNLVRSGSTVPIKFSLGPGSRPDALAGPPSSVRIDCTSHATIAGSDAPVGSMTRAKNGSYHVNWSTSRSWAGTCRRVDIQLTDGSTHSAEFAFR